MKYLKKKGLFLLFVQKRTPLNWILVNLAVSDATIGAFGAPMSAMAAMVSNWPFGETACLGYALFMSVTGEFIHSSPCKLIRGIINGVGVCVCVCRYCFHHDAGGAGPLAVHHRDVAVQEVGNGQPAGRLPHRFHLDLRPGGDDTSAIRMGTVRTRSSSHQVITDAMIILMRNKLLLLITSLVNGLVNAAINDKLILLRNPELLLLLLLLMR